MEKLLTLEEVAELLRRSPRTVCKLAIPVVRLAGRARLYDPRDVRAYVEGSKEYRIPLVQAPTMQDTSRPDKVRLV